jgi:hypothetical protein
MKKGKFLRPAKASASNSYWTENVCKVNDQTLAGKFRVVYR